MGNESEPAKPEPAPLGEQAEDTGYPPLQSVPPRPQLSYTVEQQREIVQALVADRENARYTNQVIRYRSEASTMPPPPAPPVLPAGNLNPVIAPPEAAPAEPGLEEEETLFGFIAALRASMWSDDAETAPDPAPPAPSSAAEPDALSAPGDAQELESDAAQASAAPGLTPLPPARSAIAARMAASPDVVDLIVDPTVAQAPLPGESAIAARLHEADRPAANGSQAPLPAPRPATVLAPPPFKPIMPVSAPTDRRPPDDRSAGVTGSSKAVDAVL